MPKTQHEDPNEIKIEDLLRLKRSERPDDAFWSDFDRELHHRMLQTLVKKEPWYLQLARGVSGRIPQAAALAAVAAVAMLLVVRPAILGTATNVASVANLAMVADQAPGPESHDLADLPQVAAADRPQPEPATQLAQAVRPAQAARSAADYRVDARIDAISAREAVGASGFEHDFGMDVIQVASNDADYSADSAFARVALGNTGVASLVF